MGFKNVASGKYLGHNKDGDLWRSVNEHNP
jgi:hypothetical protein